MSDIRLSSRLAALTNAAYQDALERARADALGVEASAHRRIVSRAAYAEGERRYWYFVSETYCPACGRTKTLRERVYGERPERWEDRHERDDESYDYCDAL